MVARSEPRQPQIGRRQWWILLLVAGGILMVVAVLLFPWVSSAYHIERAGRMLAKDDLSSETYLAAERALQQALERDAENAQAYWLLAGAHRQQGNLPEAADALAQVVALKPQDPLSLLTLAETCERLSVSELDAVSFGVCGSDERTREANLIALWQRAGQSAADMLPAAERFREQGDWSQAGAMYNRALLLEPESPEAWFGLASVHQAGGKMQEALEAYANAVAFGSGAELVAAAHASRAKIMAGADKWADASAEMAEAVGLVPDKGTYHLDYGWYLFQAGDPQKNARDELEEAASLVPLNPWPHIHLANLEFTEEHYQQSLEHGRRAVELAPDLFWAWLWQGKALDRLNRPAEAEESLKQAIDLAPAEAAPRVAWGKFLEKEGVLGDAIAQYEQVVSLAPDHVGHSLSLALAYRSNGQTAEARVMFRRVLELDPGNTAAERALTELGQ